MTKYYRKRTPKQTQDKIDRLKTTFMLKKIMSDSEKESIQAMIRRLVRRRRRVLSPLPSKDKEEVRKIKRVERKLKRMNEGTWRKGRTVSQNM